MVQLNPQQRAAVNHLDSPLLVLAGAGSGKTRVIIEKIARLIADGHFRADQIGAITFTNKAAREMRQRLAQRLGRRGGEGLTVSTFHSLGWQILRDDPAAVDYRPGLTILDQHSAGDLVRELLPPGAGNDLVWAVSAGISRFKDAGLAPKAALSRAESEIDGRSAEIYARYTERLKALNAVDFDDLICLPATMLEDPVAQTRWRRRLRYLLVDEYQDTSQAQYRLLKSLTGEAGRFTAVGDDDQSIYGWRGARPENLSELASDFPALTIIKLEQNYRSSGKILTAANRVIAGNEQRFEKNLWSELGPGDNLRVVDFANEADEAEAIAREILAAHHARKVRWGEFAVLYRSNHQARAIELKLREFGIPYQVSGGPSWFDAREIRDGLSYLKLLANPEDNPAFMRVANTPRRGLGSTALGRLAAYAGATGTSLFEAAMDERFQRELPTASARGLRGFSNLLIDFSDRAGRDGMASAFGELLDHLGYLAWLGEQDDDRARTERRGRNLAELKRWLERLEADTQSAEELIARVTLAAGPDDDRDEIDQVRLMTLHAAKGLEFDRVWLAGCEDGLLPHQRAIDDGQLAEERRLMYVGITRARRQLTLSHCRSRRRQGGAVECEPSRFLDELPEDVIDWPARSGATTPDRAGARANIAALRAMLDQD